MRAWVLVPAGVILGLGSAPRGVEAQVVFLRGDTNSDGQSTISDAHFSLSFMFRGTALPGCLRSADVNSDQNVDISDSIMLLIHLFLGGPAPCEPFPDPGAGPEDDRLPCARYSIEPALLDEASAIEASNAIAGPDGHATINLLVSSSRDLGGYSAILSLESGGFGGVPRVSDLSGSLAGGFQSARVSAGRIKIGFLCSLTGNETIPAGMRRPVLQLEVCLEPGLAAGDLEIKIESPELIDAATGRAIVPRTSGELLTLPVDLGANGCPSPPEPDPRRSCSGVPPIPPGGPALAFARGDVNIDGRVSISDALWVRRFIFNNGPLPPCADAADANDDGEVNSRDLHFLLRHLGEDGPPPAPPSPGRGPDPTADDLGCGSDLVTPPAPPLEDALRLGEGTGSPGGRVTIPVFLTSTTEVEALQLVLRYDPAVFVPDESGLSFQGGFFGMAGFNPMEAFVSLRRLPGEEGVLAVGFFPHLRAAGFEVPPGQDRLLFGIAGTVAPGAKPGAVSAVALTDGPGATGFGRLLLRNELSSLGRTRLPMLSAGAIRVVEAKPLLRGDANRDGGVDISDGISMLNFLFLDGQGLHCADAADANDDGVLDVSDAIAILSTLFLEASAISPPFPEPGLDPTADDFPECS